MSNEDDERVGYKRPPRKFRFKPGQSGNPKGRPRRAKDMLAILQRVLDGSVQISLEGREITVTKRNAYLRALVHKAAGGNLDAIELICRLRAPKNIEPKILPPKHSIIAETDPDVLREWKELGYKRHPPELYVTPPKK